MKWQESQAKLVVDYIGLTVGSVLVALALAYFLVPHRIAAGGISGLATVIHYVFGFPVGITMLAINVPLFLISLKQLGLSFGVRSLYGTVVLSLFTDLFAAKAYVATRDPLLAAIYGGILSGVGLGVVFRSGGTTGGTDLAARVLQKYFHTSVGRLLLGVDGVVIGLAGIVFGIELALYALASLFISSRVIDVVQEGVGYVKAALIISDRYEEIAAAIMQELERGVTRLEGCGGYTGKRRETILCVLARSEVSRLKELVARIDPSSFMVVADVQEALGEGFKEFLGRGR